MMKPIFRTLLCVLLTILMIGSAVSCSRSNAGGENPPPSKGTTPAEDEVQVDGSFAATGKILVVYFSKTNTTAAVAKEIQRLTGADLFEIERREPYPDAYTPTTEEAKQEKEANARPELKSYLPKNVVAQYDTIILGFPIWWHTAPMPVLSFLNFYDLSGKTIYTFCTSGGSELSESTADIISNSKGATVIEGKRFSGGSDSSISAWVSSLDLPEPSQTPATPSQPGEDEQPGAWNPTQDNRPGVRGTKTLVVYFSMPETTSPDNMTTEEANSTVVINGEVLGNTQYMAYVIQEQTGADIFRIIPKVPYPTDHRTLVDLASDEKSKGARPEILDTIDNLAQYDTVFVGYPNWWGDLPMILYSFFEAYDLTGKNVIPFNTHGGSGFSGTVATIRSLEPGADVLNGLSISRTHIQDAEQEMIDWVQDLGFTKPEVTSSKVLVAYFSWSNNTERLANYIAEHLNAEVDVVKIEAAVPYTSADTNYSTPNTRCEIEQKGNARPEVASATYEQIDMAQYDAVFIGYPIWWWTAPMIIGTFLEHYDLTGMDVYPFSQSASMNTEQFATSMDFIRSCAANATVHDGLFARATSTTAIDRYLAEQGF